MADIPSITAITGAVAAVGALGTASYGLVDASKAFGGGLSNAGFAFIRRTISGLLPGNDSTKDGATLLGASAILAELKASWLNGAPLKDQQAIAKSLIKLRLNADNAKALGERAGIDGDILKRVAIKISTGEALAQAETDVFGRFDLILATALDQAYQRADQRYRNWCKLAAVPVSMILAVVGGWSIHTGTYWAWNSQPLWTALVAGLLATPLAPVAKDLSTSIQTAAQAAQALKK
jgi:hypothetical protein